MWSLKLTTAGQSGQNHDRYTYQQFYQLAVDTIITWTSWESQTSGKMYN